MSDFLYIKGILHLICGYFTILCSLTLTGSPHLDKCVTRKQSLRSLSLWPRPFFFWYNTDFSEFDSDDTIDYIL